MPPVFKSLQREHPIQRAVLVVALIVLCLATLAYGSYPQWISGFTVAAFCVLGGLHLLLSWVLGKPAFPIPRNLGILVGALLAWLSAMVLRDVISGIEQDRFPALSVRVLPYAFAYAAAGMLGAGFGTRLRLKLLMKVAAGIGFVLAVVTLAQWAGVAIPGVKSLNPDRPSGLFINPNRFAVMEALCISCGLGLYLAAFVEDDTILAGPRTRLIRNMVWLAVLGAMSASLVVTLSRLTIFAFGFGLAVCACIWVRYRLRRDERTLSQLPVSERAQRVAFWSLPIIVMLGWGVMAFSVGSQALSSRYNDINNTEGRFAVMQATEPLFAPLGTKVFGTGLGSFEAVFTAVQPATLDGRWTRLHSDWMQLALEAGIPALLLTLMLLLAWVRNWWRTISEPAVEARVADDAGQEREWMSGTSSPADSNTVLRLAPLAGLLTVLIASGADFPLRETGMAMLFFFLAGALASVRPDGAAPGTQAAASRFAPARTAWMIALVAALGWSSWIAGRNALACAASPWLGQLFLPIEAGENAAFWRRSTRIDPGEEQCHYFLALAASNAKDASPDVMREGLEHLRIAAALSPRDYHVPWVAAALSERLGQIDDAKGYHERAITLFPENAALHLDAGVFYLRRLVKGRHPGNSQRIEALQKALGYFQYVVQREPQSADKIADWMDDSGCTSDEMMALWVGNGTDACVGRARYFGDRELWDFAARALAPVDPAALQASKHNTIWYHAILGMVDFYRNNDEKGIAHWAEILPLGVVRNDYAAYFWIAVRMSKLSPESAEKIAAAWGEELKSTPIWVNNIARKLHESGKDFSACALLEKTAGTTDFLCVIWADSALAIGDVTTAELQAMQVWRFRGDGSNWSDWRKDFDARLEERKRRDRDKKR